MLNVCESETFEQFISKEIIEMILLNFSSKKKIEMINFLISVFQNGTKNYFDVSISKNIDKDLKKAQLDGINYNSNLDYLGKKVNISVKLESPDSELLIRFHKFMVNSLLEIERIVYSNSF